MLFIRPFEKNKNGTYYVMALASVRPSDVNISFPNNSSYSLNPIKLKLGI